MKSTRRQILSGLGSAGLGMLLPRSLNAQSDEPGPNTLSGVWLEPFVDPLPVPRILKPVSASAESQQYVIAMPEFRQKVHRDLPPTLMWEGYDFVSSRPGNPHYHSISRHAWTLCLALPHAGA